MGKPNSKILLFFASTLFLSCNTYKAAYIGESFDKYSSTWNKNKDNMHPDVYYLDSAQTIYLYCTKKKKEFFSGVNIGGEYKPTYISNCVKGIYYTFKNGLCVAINQQAPIIVTTK